MGRYYRDYVELMAHFDEVLPGRVHRVSYERMVGDTESEIRRLLAYCGLAFEEACLRFNETERAVRTASSEQVRTPIFSDGVEQWRNFEQWLGPLKRGAWADARSRRELKSKLGILRGTTMNTNTTSISRRMRAKT